MNETVSTLDILTRAKEAEGNARTAATQRITVIQVERRRANDEWSAEIEALKSSLRVRAPRTNKVTVANKPKPAIELAEQA